MIGSSVNMEVFPIFRSVAAKRIVEVLTFGQVSLHLEVLGTNDIGVLLVREEKSAAVVIEVVVEERLQFDHVAVSSAAWVLLLGWSAPFVVCWHVLSFRVSQLRHFSVMVVCNGGLCLVKIERFSLLSCLLLLLQMSFAFFLGHSRIIVRFHRQPRVIQHALSRSSLVRVPVQHRDQKVGERHSFFLIKLVLFLEDLRQWPEVEPADVS